MYWLKDKFRSIKVKRARGKQEVPTEDAWDLRMTFAIMIWKGLDRLMEDRSKAATPKQDQRDLLFIRDYFKDYATKYLWDLYPTEALESIEDYEECLHKEHDRQVKAFKLLAKHFDGLWW